MGNRKLGRAPDQRKAILRNQVTALLWNGKIVTTEARAKEVRSIAEKIVTLAAKEHGNTVEVTKKTSEGEKTFKNDAPSKLHARRLIMAQLYNIKDVRKDSETAAEYKDRIADHKYPVMEKIFSEIGPKYTERKGGYTRMIKMGPRRGDSAEMVILELV